MNKAVFLFPGQGSQYEGMAEDLYERFAEAREIIDQADRLLGFPLSELMFGKSAEGDAALKRTDRTQPALYVHSMAVMAILRRTDLRAAMAAGHSLGEYSALVAAGALSFEDGLRLVRCRGELMANADDERPGAMAAVLGMEDDQVIRACEEVSGASDSVVAANFNAPGQVVISGDASAVERAMQEVRARGARRVVQLPVNGAFHSPLMEQARGGLERALSGCTIRSPLFPVYLNVTALATCDPEEIRQALVAQLTSPVYWSRSLRNMHEDGADGYIEIGAGNVLCGLARRTLGRDIKTVFAGKAEELALILARAC
ncbi:MAG: ACP S-malonyltransferase [Bacteroidetes bacterium SB0662_bin_6]|nr:ACP S-malonyltransferase [Bacteroidetes bacterium SB0668_bin_1]MYE04015.1 ACP S-malonyltransferase [Bacteroidetes bacterium SB0662_bin_6]